MGFVSIARGKLNIILVIFVGAKRRPSQSATVFAKQKLAKSCRHYIEKWGSARLFFESFNEFY